MPPAAPVTAALAAAGGGGKRAGGRAEGRLLPPCQDRRFLSSLGPSHARTRAPPLAAPRPQDSESFAFHLLETKRGSAMMGQAVQGPKDWALPQTRGVKERMEEKAETPSYQVG